jgi:hypothetical protein
MMTEQTDRVLIMDWSDLSRDQIVDRINWLRTSMVAGTDWGFCEELSTCVLFNDDVALMYKMAWLDGEIDHHPTLEPALLGRNRRKYMDNVKTTGE